MTSSWSTKLETKLSALTDAASRESIESLAQWIGFNRKHSKAFCVTLDSLLQQQQGSSTPRSWLYLQLIHQILQLERDNQAKWNRLSETRTLLGETVLVPALERMNDDATKEKVKPLLDEWEKHNVFDDSNLVEKMRKLLSSKEEVKQQEEAKPEKMQVDSGETGTGAKQGQEESAATKKPVEPPAKKDTKEEDNAEKETKEDRAERPASPPGVSLKPSASNDEVTFDFENSGIPYAKVESREFLEPCKAIATLQIARDLRNDAAVQLSSRLSAIPEEIQAVCRDALKEKEESGTTLELTQEQATKYAEMLGDDILDTDMDEALMNLKTFVGLVKQQQQARRKLIRLLIQSRCQFGSDEAAELYYSLDGKIEELKKRKALLSDAMDLEGLDFQEDNQADAEANEKKLEPLAWYEPDAKRSKTS